MQRVPALARLAKYLCEGPDHATVFYGLFHPMVKSVGVHGVDIGCGIFRGRVGPPRAGMAEAVGRGTGARGCDVRPASRAGRGAGMRSGG